MCALMRVLSYVTYVCQFLVAFVLTLFGVFCRHNLSREMGSGLLRLAGHLRNLCSWNGL